MAFSKYKLQLLLYRARRAVKCFYVDSIRMKPRKRRIAVTVLTIALIVVASVWGMGLRGRAASDLVIDATTLVLNGSHTYNNVTIRNGGILTHDQGNEEGLNLIIDGELTIDRTSKIDVSGKGYSGGYSYGDGGGPGGGKKSSANSENFPGGGGGYGGKGGNGWYVNTYYGIGGGAYGDANDINQFQLGSGGGGGNFGIYGGNGGGLIKIKAQKVVNDGIISAKGADAGTGIGGQSGGGSGGSVYIETEEIQSYGLITANGGSGTNAAGGGGRIKIVATTGIVTSGTINEGEGMAGNGAERGTYIPPVFAGGGGGTITNNYNFTYKGVSIHTKAENSSNFELANTATAKSGDTIKFTLTINNPESAAKNVDVKFELPSGFKYKGGLVYSRVNCVIPAVVSVPTVGSTGAMSWTDCIAQPNDSTIIFNALVP